MTTLPRISLLMALIPALAAPVQAQVSCANENPAVPASTPTSDFTLHADGTATHNPTNLMWMRCSLGQSWDGSTCTGTANTTTWQGALDVAVTLNSGGGFAGHTDWRVPNRNELKSIMEQRCWEPAINAAVFPETDFWSWSASPSDNFPSSAWLIDSVYGQLNTFPKTHDNFWVRLVREAE